MNEEPAAKQPADDAKKRPDAGSEAHNPMIVQDREKHLTQERPPRNWENPRRSNL